MTSKSKPADVVAVEPAFRATPWRRTPSLWQQALEAAHDGPTLRELASMLYSLSGLYVDIWHEDDPYFETVVTVDCCDGAENRVDDVLTLMRRAGWELEDVTWERQRLAFTRVGGHDG